MKMIGNIIKLVILVFFLILAVMNTHSVAFSYLPGLEITWPLIAILFITFIVGAVFGIFSMFGRVLRLRSENAQLQTELKKVKQLVEQNNTTKAESTSQQPDVK